MHVQGFVQLAGGAGGRSPFAQMFVLRKISEHEVCVASQVFKTMK